MASRRTRIKGIANIPQRRKTTAINDEQSVPEPKPEKPSVKNHNPTFNIDKIPEDEEIHFKPQPCPTNEIDDESGIYQNKAEGNSKVINQDISKPILVSNNCSIVNETNVSDINNEIKIIDIQVQNQESSDKQSDMKINNASQVDHKSKLILRRRYIKPTVSASVINRKPVLKINKSGNEPYSLVTEECVSKIEERDVTNTLCPERSSPQESVLDFNTCSEISSQQQNHISTNISTTNEIILDETHLNSQNNKLIRTDASLDDGTKKLAPHLSSNTLDIEYPPPPSSPSKINRSRIKAIPRLNYRKTSFSASESEDESRRNNRNRNDSVCSATSGIAESMIESMSPQRSKEFSSIVQKKCNRTEQSRKLAEARREFQKRFGNNKPDRQKLTMIDLIFYNPTTNPIKDEAKMKQVEFSQDNADIQVDHESEKVDDPQNINEDVGQSDEDSEMPVPQIKIGPSGEIILDEKSLVVESKEVKKQREELQKTRVVDGDFDTSYGIYKKQKRSKNWSKNETLRFYKALNIIGTDFTLMCELFPRRTRRELKMKFKKEERINRSLINRAIMQPRSFDFVELKHEVDMEEKELEALQKLKEDEAKLKKQKAEEKAPKKRKLVQDQESAEKLGEEKLGKDVCPIPPKIRKVRKLRTKKLNIESVLEDSDADESDIATQSESDDEISMPLRPTRSGRVPKVAKRFDYTGCTSVDNIIKTNKISDVKTEKVEPGSIMILTESGPNGEPVYKIYMVTPDLNAAPVNLTSDMVSKAIEFKKGLGAQNIMTISANITDDETENNTVAPEENNVTIPADEFVTTLKTNDNIPENNAAIKD